MQLPKTQYANHIHTNTNQMKPKQKERKTVPGVRESKTANKVNTKQTYLTVRGKQRKTSKQMMISQ